MLAQVNQVEYGLTCSIWTNDLVTAHRTAAAVEAGFVWINDVSKHFLGAPFGGYKQSGVGREEGIEELISFTREKNIHLNLKTPHRRALGCAVILIGNALVGCPLMPRSDGKADIPRVAFAPKRESNASAS